jgi:UPF0755 protein
VKVAGEPGFDRRSSSDWAVDDWDDVGEVPAVEPLPRQSRLVKWTVWGVMGIVLAMILIAGWVGWWYLERVKPEGEVTEAVPFTVLAGDNVDSLAARLQQEGFVEDASVFTWYVDQHGGLEIVPGYYQLRHNDHMGNVLGRLKTPPDQTFGKVTFPEGFTLQQMADRLAEDTPRLSAAAFLAAANSPDVVSAYRPAGVTTMEGLLFPDTYQVSNADNEAQVVERMTTLMERVANQEDLENKAAILGRSPYDMFIIASMIEKEAKLDADRPKIARVIYNRLFTGMPLQIDATLLYGQPPGTSPSAMRDVDTPYNTYLHTGLPPTPIANPGRASIQAALNPAPNPSSGDPICIDLKQRAQASGEPEPPCVYLYYVLGDEDGGHVFAASLEQHEANVQRARDLGLLG